MTTHLARAGAVLGAATLAVALGSLSPAAAQSANQPCEPEPHVYCPTPSGPSQNGNSGGDNGQRPDAGTVGNADNKNPRGQQPNADEDGNNGYECDGNNGIAKGNPAHTGCIDY